MCAWLLIALMVPGSLVSSALVWCVSSDGHAAVEFSAGPGGHHSGPVSASQTRSGSSLQAVFEHLCHDTDCVDFPAISSTIFAKERRLEKPDKSFNAADGADVFVALALLSQDVSLQTSHDPARLSDVESRDLIDPTILSRRFTVLQI